MEWGIGKRRRYWPGGGRGGIPLEGIASPGVGRIRLEESRRIGRQARMMRAIPSGVGHARIWFGKEDFLDSQGRGRRKGQRLGMMG